MDESGSTGRTAGRRDPLARLDRIPVWPYERRLLWVVTTYLGEISPAPLRGRYISWATTAAYAGFAVVPVIARGLVPNFASGWRILFGIGALGGFTILFMRQRPRPWRRP
jgi:MFS family permease